MVIHSTKYQTKAENEQQLATNFCDELKDELSFKTLSPTNRGLYVCTNLSGVFESVELWRNALEHSPRFANPGMFPWTLANATAGLISRSLDIRGSNYTLLHEDPEFDELMPLFKMDKNHGKVQQGLLILWKVEIDSKILRLHADWTLVD